MGRFEVGAQRPVSLAPVLQKPSLIDLIEKYDSRVPRYTSYPTAVQFTEAVGPSTYRQWLAELDPGQAVSLYLHIPFCSRLCWYCGCNTRAVNRPEPVGEYVRLLLDELAMLRQALPATMMAASAVHFGGGTPNMLSIDELAAIFGGLRSAFSFIDNPQIAAELDPEILTREWVRAATSHGLNRASLGVQNLSPDVQRAVNRPERFEHIARCVQWLREDGVTSINLDLMYGLPNQTTGNTLETVRQIATLRPERIALFGYAHVPWMKSHQKLIDETALPGPAERLDQSEAAAEALAQEGYVRIGLDHYALAHDEMAHALAEGRLHRNFQGYTADEAGVLLGLGASAIGSMPQGFVQNHAQELAWRKAVASGELPVARGVALDPDDRFRGEIIERLMCDLSVDLAPICAAHGRDLAELEGERARLDRFVADGLAQVSWPKIRLTEMGRLLVRSVCAVFDAHLQAGAVRHSKAI